MTSGPTQTIHLNAAGCNPVHRVCSFPWVTGPASAQEYQSPLLILTGEEYDKITFAFARTNLLSFARQSSASDRSNHLRDLQTCLRREETGFAANDMVKVDHEDDPRSL